MGLSFRKAQTDKFKLPGFYKFCHAEEFFKFSSRHSKPLREHLDVGVFSVSASSPPTSHPLARRHSLSLTALDMMSSLPRVFALRCIGLERYRT